MESATIDLATYIRAVWKRKWLILAVTFVAAAASAVVTLREPQLYTAKSLIKVGRIWGEQIEDPYILAEIAGTEPFLARVGERLKNKRSSKELAGRLSAEKLEGGKARNRYVYLIRLTAFAETSEEAQELAQAAAEQIIERTDKAYDSAYPAYVEKEKALQKRIEDMKSGIASASNPAAPKLEADRLELLNLERELFEIQTNNASPLKTYRTQLAEEISPPRRTPPPSLLKRVLTASAAAFAFGILGALALELGLPILKSV